MIARCSAMEEQLMTHVGRMTIDQSLVGFVRVCQE